MSSSSVAVPTAASSSTERERWLAERRNGIGGSDAAVAVGVSPYKSPFKLWLEKLGEVPEEDLSGKPAVEWGNRLEATVADWYADTTGKKIARVNRIIWDKQNLFDGSPFLLANVDRRVLGERRGLEIKTASFWVGQSEEWGAPGEATKENDLVPAPYLLQCQHYINVTGWDIWDLAVLVGGSDPRIYTIHRDNDLIRDLVALERVFWDCVKHRKPPAALTAAHAREKFPQVQVGKVVEATQEIRDLCWARVDKKTELKAGEKELTKIEGKILDYLGDGETLMYENDIIATWKQQTRGEYNAKASTFRVLRFPKD